MRCSRDGSNASPLGAGPAESLPMSMALAPLASAAAAAAAFLLTRFGLRQAQALFTIVW